MLFCVVQRAKSFGGLLGEGFDFKASAQKVALVNDSKPAHKTKHSRTNISSILKGKRTKTRPGGNTFGLSALKGAVSGKGIDRMLVGAVSAVVREGTDDALKVTETLSPHLLKRKDQRYKP